MQTFGSDILAIADELTEAYVEVFTAPPWDHRDLEQTRTAFRSRLEEDAHREGFRAVVAWSAGGRIDGFVTGWITPDQFRTDRAYGKVVDRLGIDQVRSLLIGALEIDELGVRRHACGRGLGRRLLEAIAEEPAWLLTWSRAHDAIGFYRRLGWKEIEGLPGEENDITVFLSPNRLMPPSDIRRH